MNKKLFVGNLPFKTSESELERIFAEVGEVASVAMPIDRETGRKRGFAFVEMSTQEDADEACKRFNGYDLEGRQLVVNPAKDRQGGAGPRPARNGSRIA